MKKATLKFSHEGGMSGFTGLHTASFNDLKPARIIRELLQNSLDAAVEAKEPTAIVRFRVTFIKDDLVPDMKGYKKAFSDAVTDNEKAAGGTLPDAAQHVVDSIRKALDLLAEGGHCLLSVMDNGVGLNDKTMTALLGDGSSAKSTGAAGSYGVGHFAAAPASDLRYLLYGGVLKDGEKIASGFTILAGRHGKKYPYSARGYLVEKLLGGRDTQGKLYKFLNRNAIPETIADTLQEIQDDWGHGSVVMIPAFNYFGYFDRKDISLRDIVRKVSAYNFSAAIHAGKLVVEIDEEAIEGGEKTQVDANNLGALLDEESNKQRASRSDTIFEGLRPSGQYAWAAYTTMSTGSQDVIKTPSGPIDVNLLTPAPAGATRFDLFRNGMWITDSVPGLSRSDFVDWQSFHAVLQPRRDTDFHRLVRSAEGPMHDHLAFNLLSKDQKKQLKKAFSAVSDWIKSKVPKIKTDEYTPDDFLLVATGGEIDGSGRREFSVWGSPVVVQRPRMSQRELFDSGAREEMEPDGEKSGKGSQDGPKRKQPSRSSSRPLPFRSTVVPQSRGKHNIELECDENFDEVLLRIRIDENADATCDRVWQDEEAVIQSFQARDGTGRALKGWLEDGNKAIVLVGLVAKTTYRLTVEHEAPADLGAVQTPVFRVDLHRRQKPEDDGTADDS